VSKILFGQNYDIHFTVEKSRPEILATHGCKKVNNRTKGENSSNLVILVLWTIAYRPDSSFWFYARRKHWAYIPLSWQLL
jgi:hypothetical protein